MMVDIEPPTEPKYIETKPHWTVTNACFSFTISFIYGTLPLLSIHHSVVKHKKKNFLSSHH